MAFSITQFQNSPGPDQLSALDNNFTTLSAQAPIPCGVSGTNTLVLTQNAAGLVPTVTIAAYTQGMSFSGIASATNTGPVTANVGTAGALNVYKDTPSGPQVLSGSEIVIGNAFTMVYDPALNSGAGGFHLVSTTAQWNTRINPSAIQVNGNATITNLLSGGVSVTFNATAGWSSQDQSFTLTGLPPNIPLVGDFVQVTPPSLAAVGVDFSAMVTAVGSLSSVASVATVNIRLLNAASASLASNSGLYRWAAWRTVP
jgi:hypothetical protein